MTWIRPLLERVPRSRVVLGLGALAAIALTVLLGRPDRIEVDTARVTRGPLEVTIQEDGVTRVRDRFVVSSPVTGRLDRVGLQPGDSVRPGQRLAQVFPLPLDTRARQVAAERLAAAEASERAAAARVAQATAANQQAERSLARLEQVEQATPGAISAQRLDDARSATRTMSAALDEARAAAAAAGYEVEAARTQLLGAVTVADVDRAAGTPDADTRGGRTADIGQEVASPCSGQVLRVLQESERVVSAGTPILELGDGSSLEIVVDVLTDDAVWLAEGNTVHITVGAAADTLPGRITRIEPAAFTRVSPLGVEEQRVNVIVELAAEVGEVAESGEAAARPAPVLGDGFRVQAELVVWRSAEVTRVPVSALVRAGREWAVYRVHEGRATLQPIVIDHRATRWAEVIDGLAPDDEVVTYPPESLTDGARVEVRTRQTM